METEQIITLIKALPQSEQEIIFDLLKELLNSKRGKRVYTEKEITEIRALITKKLKASQSQQKGIRQQIRNIGFYFSDYNADGHKYDLGGFEYLIKSGQIKVTSP